jgi:plasmid stabilization system protein ParE
MTRRIVQRPRAEQDIIDQAFHIHRDNPVAARRFEKHLIFYRPMKDGIEVIRVLHASRDLVAVLDEDSDA